MQGNGDNTCFYTCNVRARTRAHARVLVSAQTVTTVAGVAKPGKHATNRHFESVARPASTVASVALAAIASDFSVPELRSTARDPPTDRLIQTQRATTASSTKSRSVAALTTIIPSETFMPSTDLALPLEEANPLVTGLASSSGAVLSLDLGTTTGWAIRLPGGSIESGSTSFRPSRYDGGGMRYLRFRGWLQGIAGDAGAIAAIYFEEVRRHLGTDAAHVYGGLLATLTAWCEQQRIPYEGVPVGSIKRFIAGKGNADKHAVIEAVRSRGFHPKDDNEADAIAILLWAIETGGGVR